MVDALLYATAFKLFAGSFESVPLVLDRCDRMYKATVVLKTMTEQVFSSRGRHVLGAEAVSNTSKAPSMRLYFAYRQKSTADFAQALLDLECNKSN